LRLAIPYPGALDPRPRHEGVSAPLGRAVAVTVSGRVTNPLPGMGSGRPGICTNRICSVTSKLLTKTVDTALGLFCPDCPFSMQLACFAIFLALDGFAVNSQRRWHRAIKLVIMPDIRGTIGGTRSGNNGACIACLQLRTICPSQTLVVDYLSRSICVVQRTPSHQLAGAS
jgi:hypothetical protein